ncbi:MAG: hypothetical protein ABSH28_11175 [Acidobacteriota bacterium]|jgi:hypothetical protein
MSDVVAAKSYRVPRYRVCLVRDGSNVADFRRFSKLLTNPTDLLLRL